VHDDGPSICSTSRGRTADGSEPMSQRGLPPPGASARAYEINPMGAAGGASARAGASSARGGQLSSRMTPRVPLAGEVSSRLTPRMPHAGGVASSGRGASSRSTPSAYRGGPGRAYQINPTLMGALERDKMLYLAKKLVHLSILLEQDTVTEDFKYPSFHAPPQQPFGS
jgi:hypothetical protein